MSYFGIYDVKLPICWRCNRTVEKFDIKPSNHKMYCELHISCHGETSIFQISLEQLMNTNVETFNKVIGQLPLFPEGMNNSFREYKAEYLSKMNRQSLIECGDYKNIEEDLWNNFNYFDPIIPEKASPPALEPEPEIEPKVVIVDSLE